MKIETIDVYSLHKASSLSAVRCADFSEAAACLLLNLPFPTENAFRQAKKMVAYGLTGNPPTEIAEELRQAWKELISYFQQKAA